MELKENTYYHNLINKHFAGEATLTEMDEITLWIKLSNENKKYFDDSKSINEIILKSQIIDQDQEDGDWTKIRSRFDLGEQGNKEMPEVTISNKNIIRQLMKVAAAFIIMMVPVYFLYQTLTERDMFIMTAYQDVVENSLSDGTKVSLNKGTTLEYPEQFRGKHRNVKLNGEAYFNVTKNEEMPFLINMDPYYIQVLGTSFYVNTKNEENKLEVILDEGKVVLYHKLDKSNVIILNPNEKAEVTIGNLEIKKIENLNKNYSSWKTHNFSFDNQPLEKIILDLQKVYTFKYTFDTETLKNCRLTANFNDQSIEAIMNIIEASLDIEIKLTNQVYIIGGDGC